MVGLFFADVVSARDLRSFYLPDFEQLRIPQWAARAEYYFGETHAELVWIPVPSYDNIGKPGSEFYPLPKGASVRGEVRPDSSLGNTNWGGRVSKTGICPASITAALMSHRLFTWSALTSSSRATSGSLSSAEPWRKISVTSS